MMEPLLPTPTSDSPGGTPESFLTRKKGYDGKLGVTLTDLRLVLMQVCNASES